MNDPLGTINEILKNWPEVQGYIQEQDGLEICLECNLQLGEGYPECDPCSEYARRKAMIDLRSEILRMENFGCGECGGRGRFGHADGCTQYEIDKANEEHERKNAPYRTPDQGA